MTKTEFSQKSEISFEFWSLVSVATEGCEDLEVSADTSQFGIYLLFGACYLEFPI